MENEVPGNQVIFDQVKVEVEVEAGHDPTPHSRAIRLGQRMHTIQ
jgi:hypothetical protein